MTWRFMDQPVPGARGALKDELILKDLRAEQREESEDPRAG